MTEPEEDKTPDQIIDITHSTDQLDSVHIMSDEKKRVCVIGSGASGLVSMKVCTLLFFDRLKKGQFIVY